MTVIVAAGIETVSEKLMISSIPLRKESLNPGVGWKRLKEKKTEFTKEE